jgi:hypothetical protein
LEENIASNFNAEKDLPVFADVLDDILFAPE